MKKYYLPALAFTVLLYTPVVMAQQGQGHGQGDGMGQPIDMPMPGDAVDPAYTQAGYQVQNQNTVQTQNQGEENQLQVNTQNSEQSQFNSGSGPQGSLNRSSVARSNMSDVSRAVEDFLATGNKTGVIGQKVSDIAKQQEQAQLGMESAMKKIESRQGILRALIGHNAKAIDQMNQYMEQNQLRIQELQELMTQTQNRGEVTQLQVMVDAMIAQNTALKNMLQAEKADNGMFGWVMKLFK